MNITPEQQKAIDESYKEFEKKMMSMKTYTHEELAKFKEKGVEGKVCICKLHIMNSMTLECPVCGKVLPEYAKAYARRR